MRRPSLRTGPVVSLRRYLSWPHQVSAVRRHPYFFLQQSDASRGVRKTHPREGRIGGRRRGWVRISQLPTILSLVLRSVRVGDNTNWPLRWGSGAFPQCVLGRRQQWGQLKLLRAKRILGVGPTLSTPELGFRAHEAAADKAPIHTPLLPPSSITVSLCSYVMRIILSATKND